MPLKNTARAGLYASRVIPAIFFPLFINISVFSMSYQYQREITSKI